MNRRLVFEQCSRADAVHTNVFGIRVVLVADGYGLLHEWIDDERTAAMVDKSGYAYMRRVRPAHEQAYTDWGVLGAA